MDRVAWCDELLDRSNIAAGPDTLIHVPDNSSRIARPSVRTFRGQPSLGNGVIADVLRPAAHELLETSEVTGEQRAPGFLVVRAVAGHAVKKAAQCLACALRALLARLRFHRLLDE